MCRRIGLNISIGSGEVSKVDRLGFHYAAEAHGGKVISEGDDGTVVAFPEGEVTYKGGSFEARGVGPEKAQQVAMMATAPNITNPVILAVSGGFYFFGNLVKGDPEYATLEYPAMFGGFGGGKGLPGVARGDRDATVTLDRFDDNQRIMSPLWSGATLAVMQSINLYAFSGCTLR